MPQASSTGLLVSPPFQIFAICGVVLTLKILALSFYTVWVRMRDRSYSTPEDRAMMKVPERGPHPLVERIHRAQRNDLENILPFFTIGLIYALGGASLRGAQVYFFTFTIARILHSWFFLAGLQPWRFISWMLGVACLLGMMAQILIKVF